MQTLLASLGSFCRSIGAQPESHAHVKVPGVFVHEASRPQTVELKHSSMSEKGKVRSSQEQVCLAGFVCLYLQ